MVAHTLPGAMCFEVNHGAFHKLMGATLQEGDVSVLLKFIKGNRLAGKPPGEALFEVELSEWD